jgi:hypothetical protein
MSEDKYLSLTELAELVGGTSHSVGRTLTTAGLRRNGKPSSQAFALGLVQQAPTNRGSGYFYKWHRDKTMPYLIRKNTSDSATSY